MSTIAEETSYGRYIVRGAGITFIGLVTIGVSHLILRMFLAQGLSKAEFGLFFAVFSFFSFINVFSHLGLNRAIIRFVSKFKTEKKLGQVKSSILTSLIVITGTSLLIPGLVIGLSNFLASSYFESPKAVPVLIILSIWFFFMSFHNFLLSTLQGFKDFFGRTLGRIIRSLVPSIGVVIFATLFDLELISAATSYLLGAIISTFLLYIFLRRRHYSKLSKAPSSISGSLMKKMVLFGMPLILSGVATSVIGRMDTLMLTGLRSLDDVGIYKIAKVTRPVLMYFGSALAAPLFPMVSELWAKKDVRKLRNALALMIKYSIILVVPAALVFIAFPEIIIRFLFGSKYLAATNAMRVLAFSVIFLAVGSIFTSSLSGIGKTPLVLRATGTAAVFDIPANFLLIPPYGATGAALATGVSFLIMFALSFYYAKREIDFTLPFSPLIKTGAGGAITLILIFSLKSILPVPLWPKFFLVLALSTLFYLGWLFWARVIREEDLDIIVTSVPIPEKVNSFLRKLSRE